MKNLVIIGWGRMGITHSSILGGMAAVTIEIVEHDPKIRKILSANFDYLVYSNISEVDMKGKYVVVSTPPAFHKDITESVLSRGAKRVFVEKPGGLSQQKLPVDDRIIVGYVLRYTEVAQLLREIVEDEGCLELSLDYSSHTVTSKTKGWRSESNSGLLEEVGCHMLDLMNYILCPSKVDIVSLKGERYFSKGYDMLKGHFVADKSVFKLSLNWSDPKRRKPFWHGELKTNKRTIKFDQQKLDIPFDINTVDYYVRGREFSNQMLHFINDDMSIGCSSRSSNNVHDLIQRINKVK